jgi:hypothetical protein
MEFRFAIVNQQSGKSGLKQTKGENHELRFEPILLRSMASLHYSSGAAGVGGSVSNDNSQNEGQNLRLPQYSGPRSRAKSSIIATDNLVPNKR